MDGMPAYSPNGEQIAFVSERDGAYDIFIMNADGTEKRNITRSLSRDFAPTWAPDGSRIAFHSYVGGSWDIYVINIDGSGLFNLTRKPENSDF